MTFYSRKPTRIYQYDYSKNNCYFITVCAYQRRCIFGQPDQLNRYGKIVQEHILRLPSYYQGIKIDRYVVMPNHIHLMLTLEQGEHNPDIRYVIALMKTGVTKEIHKHDPDMNVWQRSFHDHIIRNQKSYERIWNYIENNPAKWEEDCFYRKSSGSLR